MAKKPYLSVEKLRQLIAYNPETGGLTWKARDPKMFSDCARGRNWQANRWNSRHAGQPALNCIGVQGYRQGFVLSRHCIAHRAAFALHYGRWPEGEVDHINGDRSDNRIVNLRDVSKAKNQRNAGVRADNTSGRAGVKWDAKYNKWRVTIGVHGKREDIGRYADFAEAVSAREAAEAKYGYHKNTRRTAKAG